MTEALGQCTLNFFPFLHVTYFCSPHLMSLWTTKKCMWHCRASSPTEKVNSDQQIKTRLNIEQMQPKQGQRPHLWKGGEPIHFSNHKHLKKKKWNCIFNMKHSTGPDTSPQHYESSFFTRCLKQCVDVVVLHPHPPRAPHPWHESQTELPPWRQTVRGCSTNMVGMMSTTSKRIT